MPAIYRWRLKEFQSILAYLLCVISKTIVAVSVLTLPLTKINTETPFTFLTVQQNTVYCDESRDKTTFHSRKPNKQRALHLSSPSAI